MKTLKIAVLVSGNGSNLQVLIDQMQSGKLPIDIVAVVSNKADAYALTRAKNANIATFVIDKNEQGKTYKRAEFERLALHVLKPLGVDLVVLAGFMKILTPLFINGVKDELNAPMINLHPSLLPAYKGLDTHERVLKSGERYHGCSVHLVTAELDAGQILSQAVLDIHADDTPAILQNRVHALEHMLLPRTIDFIAHGVIDVENVGDVYRFWGN
ncbi:phosphoribosylglycinamide formyltransferase [Moraxella bovis]|uniref:Phosphoribosylglycinamide formyltransferase n=1 Tax=Moraxella bovis TaxID=476 RepID=A0AAQ2T3U7_MORBO|nr:phosphoribosylglycinamide formyltransferase [Moraxella bovis]AWY20539.1 phosphoribosylglycinamide formyltransferase [Moraxella bovis]OOR90788.1 phosphoribosylglycinamide formyltransferase [Moraxella bovis]UYZ76782.1 phosphoribosylglycinamide formyltransferase [Moraxella bovis]UYZ77263.1 phosphoribosylglycinamide formyltransferase [Moraxella bovis]UYZ82256.1 phosphoribosylglycinamide formyltransferase [Moraxella bovis]